MRVLILEQGLRASSPAKNWEKVFRRLDVPVEVRALHGDLSLVQTFMAMRMAEVVIFTAYVSLSNRSRAVLGLAALLRKRLIRVWVGSDVLNARSNASVGAEARQLRSIVSRDLAHGEHLCSSLQNIGIQAIPCVLVIDSVDQVTESQSEALPKSCLAYLPTGREQFYGSEQVEVAVKEFPELKFFIVADINHYFAKYPNCESLGWVDDMASVWNKVGALIRMTEHDGIPRMALEAMARGKLVLLSHVLPGARHVTTTEQLLKELEGLERGLQSQQEGAAAARQMASLGQWRALVDQIAGVQHRTSFVSGLVYLGGVAISVLRRRLSSAAQRS